jgi:hypothetical protein
MEKEIRVEHKNEKDIRNYLRHNLEDFEEDESHKQKLEDEMWSRSSGLFLWVKLVCAKVVTEQRKGRNLEQIRQSLRMRLSELSDFFNAILEQLSAGSDSTRSRWLFQWLCFSRRPLTLTEL